VDEDLQAARRRFEAQPDAEAGERLRAALDRAGLRPPLPSLPPLPPESPVTLEPPNAGPGHSRPREWLCRAGELLLDSGGEAGYVSLRYDVGGRRALAVLIIDSARWIILGEGPRSRSWETLCGALREPLCVGWTLQDLELDARISLGGEVTPELRDLLDHTAGMLQEKDRQRLAGDLDQSGARPPLPSPPPSPPAGAPALGSLRSWLDRSGAVLRLEEDAEQQRTFVVLRYAAEPIEALAVLVDDPSWWDHLPSEHGPGEEWQHVRDVLAAPLAIGWTLAALRERVGAGADAALVELLDDMHASGWV
jgi:hypothetical protein